MDVSRMDSTATGRKEKQRAFEVANTTDDQQEGGKRGWEEQGDQPSSGMYGERERERREKSASQKKRKEGVAIGMLSSRVNSEEAAAAAATPTTRMIIANDRVDEGMNMNNDDNNNNNTEGTFVPPSRTVQKGWALALPELTITYYYGDAVPWVLRLFLALLRVT
jgi:hypothetical protein